MGLHRDGGRALTAHRNEARTLRPGTDPILPGRRVFRRTASALALGFALLVVLLLAADTIYIADFLLHASPERVTKLRDDVLSNDTRQELTLSLVTSTITTLLALLVAVPAGYALSRFRIPGRVVVDTLVDVAIVLPPLIMGLSLLILFSMLRRFGNSVGPAGGPILAFYDFFVSQRPGIVAAQFFVATALAVRAVKAAFDAADRRVEDVALTLGCGHFGAFWRAALPQAVPGILAGAVMAWSYSMGLFAPVAIFASTVTGRTAVLPTRAYLEITNGNLERALTLVLIMTAFAVVCLVLLKVFTRRRTDLPGIAP